MAKKNLASAEIASAIVASAIVEESLLADDEQLFAKYQEEQEELKAKLKAKFFAPHVAKLAKAYEQRNAAVAEIVRIEAFLAKAEGRKPEAAKPTKTSGGKRIRRTAEQLAEDAKKILADGDAIYAELKKRKSEGPIPSKELQVYATNGSPVTPALVTLVNEGKVTRHGKGISTAYSWAK